ncbi:three-Cys-motif partner protein [Pseudonocardia sediminis]|uniref:Three-Cys-motif partner protein n=1 Tax=Pseudonocardia sediminis TaxID=1397368 RepID=A0A4Q7U7P4_PSEST|nr:three-Cys-motif partner protein TcmP [Pseudonocardia sediminis]RZT75507.1 three-Cys-motif partner protein [Pseudonocardia sediminis]
MESLRQGLRDHLRPRAPGVTQRTSLPRHCPRYLVLTGGDLVATGAGDEYWAEPNLPSTFKHELLTRYVPMFTGMTGSRAQGHRVVFLDGYAGRGRYGNGSAGSPERIMQMAEHQHRTVGLTCASYFVEQDPTSANDLAGVVAEYTRRGVPAHVRDTNVDSVLEEVLTSAHGHPLFLFLDPTGYGLPYQRLVDILAGPRSSIWPPTELLLNFSLEAVRRTGGHVSSPQGNENSMRRLDDAVGGDWWREVFRSHGVTDDAVRHVSEGFARRLSTATGMHVISVPVRRAPGHKPLYHLVFGTRSQHGLWLFGDSVARAMQKWWDTLERIDSAFDPDALFTVTEAIRPDLATVENRAVPVIAEQLAGLLDQVPSFTTVNHTLAVFGDFYGQVRDSTVRTAVKRLYDASRTSCDGKRVKPHQLVVTRPRLHRASAHPRQVS